MPRVTGVDKDQGHDNTINNTSGIIPSFTDDKNGSDLDTIIEEVKQEFRNLLIKRKDLITRLGNAFESVYASTPESVCEEIKNSLRDEIRDKIISARDIERYCPDKWKKKTKPKNDKLSFSKQVEKPQLQIAATQEGKSVIINEPFRDTETYPTSSTGINQHHEQPKQNRIGVDDDGETQTTATNQGKLADYKEPKETSTINNFTPTHTVEKLSSHPSDKQECSQCVEFTIPKEKYAMVWDAMDKSKASIFVKFDGNNNFLGADPDMVFDISGANHRDRNVQQSDDVAKDEADSKRHSKGHRKAVSDIRNK